MYWVEGDKDDLVFPAECACCLVPTSTTMSVTGRKGLWQFLGYLQATSTISVPYCDACSRHAAWHAAGGRAGAVLRPVAAFAIGFAVAIVPNLVAWALVGLGSPVLAWLPSVVAGCLAAVVAAKRHLSHRPEESPDGRHAWPRAAVEVAAFGGSFVRLLVRSDTFARRTLEQSALAAGDSVELAQPQPVNPYQLAGLVLAVVILGLAVWYVWTIGI
jgi:hypothetical protein